MVISNKAKGSLFEAFLYAGSVIRCELVFPDGKKKFKRLIVISNKNKYTTLFLTSTSKINRKYKFYRKDDIFVQKGDESCFEKDTCIQLNRVFEISSPKLVSEYVNNKLDILNKISDELMEKIYIAINKSVLIEQKYIKRIMLEKIHKR
ncbi:MAG: hypothetical protein KAW92_13200 [Candidatus Cloacimonetes bacterium]|nr:hypothetical protein [Candidatus Cloacimonadota bacterium]